MKLLLIEDDPIISETVTICFNLRWPESEVLAVESGEEGLALAESESPDVIILDVGLPGIDGYETLKLLRQITEAPAIMLTARDSEVAKVKGLERPVRAWRIARRRGPTRRLRPVPRRAPGILRSEPAARHREPRRLGRDLRTSAESGHRRRADGEFHP